LVNGKIQKQEKGNMYITAAKTATGNLDNGKMGINK